MSETGNVRVSNNADPSRYEICTDSRFAGFINYRQRDRRIVLIDTEIGDEFAGKGPEPSWPSTPSKRRTPLA
jgi:predicted GNAT family acetyltransferase